MTGAAALGQDAVQAEARIPDLWVRGEGFRVEVSYTAGAAGGTLEAWQLSAAAFEAGGKPLAERSNTASLALGPGDRLELDLDLSAALQAQRFGFELSLHAGRGSAQQVHLLEPLGTELDFMGAPLEQLGQYLVLMRTTQGAMLFELWPEVAPQHVRNWLDLSASGFYDGVQFHRVSPSFMIQGGCPNTRNDRRDRWGLGVGPRTLPLELSDRLHEQGVLSMARGPELDSASSQFFVITRSSPQLDGSYSAFGKLISGFNVLSKIGNAKGRLKNGTITPDQPQRILQAIVVREPAPEGQGSER